MGRRFSKRGGSTRFNGRERHNRDEKAGKKDSHAEDRLTQSLESPHSSEDDVYDDIDEELEEEEDMVDRELVHREPTAYNELVEKLAGRNYEAIEQLKKRKRGNEVARKSEDYNDSDPDSIHMSGKGDEIGDSEDEEEGDDSSLGDKEASDLSTYDTDVEEHTDAVASTSEAKSSFAIHVAHILSKEDVDDLSKRKWKYRWEVPAFDNSGSKWKGTGDCVFKEMEPACHYGLKLKLYNHWLDFYKAAGGTDFHSSKQRSFFSLCNSYKDIMHHNKKPFYLKGLQEDTSIMDAYIMHSLNHIFRTRDVVMKNDSKLAKHEETASEAVLSSDSFVDRGFTRPKVLVLLPLASIAFRFVKRLVQLIPSSNKVDVQYMDRFTNEFGVETEEKTEENEATGPRKSSKPADFQALFGANNNDHFMVGIKFTRKSIKLYGDFYSSDMIIASPLGLITKIGEAEVEKEKDVDYLSSIEVLIIDHADVITLQNWSHVNTVVGHLNRLPSKQHGTDIMRVRPWYLDEHAKFYRQTIILGSYLNPEINALFNHHCVNFEGKVRLSCEYKGVLPKVMLQVRQVYERFSADSLLDADDARLEYFAKKVFPKIKDSIQGGTILFVSSYFEFVRVRNFLKSQNASFCLLGDYTKQSDISRARLWFFEGKRNIMLYTERAHFYHRYKMKGIQNLIIYSLPERKEFYPEMLNMIDGSNSDKTCTVLFSRFDKLRLERIVGSSAVKRLMSSDKDIFMFC